MLVEELPNIELLLSEIKSNMRRDQIELQNVKHQGSDRLGWTKECDRRGKHGGLQKALGENEDAHGGLHRDPTTTGSNAVTFSSA